MRKISQALKTQPKSNSFFFFFLALRSGGRAGHVRLQWNKWDFVTSTELWKIECNYSLKKHATIDSKILECVLVFLDLNIQILSPSLDSLLLHFLLKPEV